jgi:hypothetical protein
MGESQPLKPQIARYRNAVVAALVRGFAQRFRPRARVSSRPLHGHNGLLLMRA